MATKGWIGVDLDGTLAEYHGWQGAHHIGAPITAMVVRVQRWLREGQQVRIFTARVWNDNGNESAPAALAQALIEDWCEKHIGRRLPVTNIKDYQMIALWDDRAVQVIPNSGVPVGNHTGE